MATTITHPRYRVVVRVREADADPTSGSGQRLHALIVSDAHVTGDGPVGTSDFADAVTRHRFGASGDYTVRVEARDTTGLACGVASDTATVRARARE